MNSEKKVIFKKENICCFAITFIAYLLIHGYRFANKAFAGDALLMIYQNDAAWQIALGRIIQPFLIMFRGGIASPLLIGLITAFFLGCGAYLISDIFEIKNKSVIVILGIVLTASDAFASANASFLPWSDFYAIAFFMAVLSVWLLEKGKWYFGIAGAVAFMVSLGIYQAYVCVAAGLACMVFILRLVKEQETKKIFRDMANYGIVFLSGAGIYYAAWKILQRILNIWTADTYNGLASVGDYSNTSVGSLLLLTYEKVIDSFWNPPLFVTLTFRENNLSVIWLYLIRCCNVLLLGLMIAGIAMMIRKYHTKILGIAAATVLLLLFPFCVNAVCFISKGMEHTLMTYAFCLVYVLALVIYEHLDISLKPVKIMHICVMLFLAVVLWNRIVFASQLYLKMDFQDTQAAALLNRIVYEVESMDGYQPGITPVAISGSFENSDYLQPIESMKQLEVKGVGKTAMTYGGTEYAYLQYILNVNMNLVRIDYEDETVKNMPCYPEKGSVSQVGDTIVVKVADY